MMKTAKILQPLLHDQAGDQTALLRLRVQMTRFAATRGWVIPFLTVRSGVADKWRKARKGDNIGYQHYLELSEGSKQLLSEIQSRTSPNDKILDLGCNVGRELNHLWQAGYRNLTGVEIGEEPVRAMREVFPSLAQGARILNASMTAAVREFKNGEFDLIYAHGSLVSLSAREQYVFDEMSRITRRWLLVLENEWSGMLFPRDFGRVFSARGMREVATTEVLTRPPGKSRVKKSMLRVFEKVRG
jgi:SAM-dependent methyltransferase